MNLLTDIDAVDLFTVVLSLFGGTLAAYVVSWRESKARRDEENKRLDEERKGLLRLINVEIEHNKYILGRFTWERDDILHREEVSSLSLDAWRDARVRLAQLVSEARFTLMADYYLDLQLITTIALNADRRADPAQDALRLVRWALEKGDKAQTYEEEVD